MLKDYLKHRKVVIEDECGSVEKVVTRGAPQGSVLGPSLWNIVFHTSMVNGVSEIAFADDKVIIVSGASRIEIQRKGQDVIDKLTKWCRENKLSLSASKTVMLQVKGKYDRARPPNIYVSAYRLMSNVSVIKPSRYFTALQEYQEKCGA